MIQEAPALGISAPKETGASFLAKIESNDQSPFYVVCKLLSESGFAITFEVAKAERGKGQEGLVAVLVSKPEDRWAIFNLMKDPRVQTIYVAVSGAGQLRLKECGWDQETERVVEGTFWHSNALRLKSVIGSLYQDLSADNTAANKRVAELKVSAQQSERKARTLAQGQALTGEQIRELISPVVAEFVASQQA